ncbi:MAG: T9SS type A sorting domain-containing protein [Muribaculaceae bacterium]|nr:T9SS type A sorting domain-containing protein [Muribaculaceae bacterium]
MRKILFTLFLSLFLSVHAVDEITVKQTSGESSWTISLVRDITFDGNGVKVSFNDDTSLYFSKETFNMIQFNVESSVIDSIQSSESKIFLEGNTLIASGNIGTIKVYSLDGTLATQVNGSSLDISNLSNGIFIIKAGNVTTKFIKR